MRCKRHTVDFSSSIGVCASCIRERLFSLAAATAVSDNDDNNHHHHCRISPPPPPLVFPRSVSPYVAPRKSDAGGGDSLASNSRFFTTPQEGSSADQFCRGGVSSSSEKVVFESGRSFKKKRSGLSRFSSFFRTRSDDFDPRRSYCNTSTFSPSSSTSRSWLSKVLTIRSKKQSTTASTCYIEDLIAAESDHHQHRPRERYRRGMSPAGDTEANDESVKYSPRRQRRMPVTGTPGRRKTAMTGIGKSVSGMSFCLSPLVRVKPYCSSYWKGKSPTEPQFQRRRLLAVTDQRSL